MTKYRGQTIEHFEGFQKPYLIHTGNMYGQYWFATLQEAKAWVDRERGR